MARYVIPVFLRIRQLFNVGVEIQPLSSGQHSVPCSFFRVSAKTVAESSPDVQKDRGNQSGDNLLHPPPLRVRQGNPRLNGFEFAKPPIASSAMCRAASASSWTLPRAPSSSVSTTIHSAMYSSTPPPASSRSASSRVGCDFSSLHRTQEFWILTPVRIQQS